MKLPTLLSSLPRLRDHNVLHLIPPHTMGNITFAHPSIPYPSPFPYSSPSPSPLTQPQAVLSQLLIDKTFLPDGGLLV